MSEETKGKLGLDDLKVGKRKKNEPLAEEKIKQDKVAELQRIMMPMTPTVTPRDIEELKKRLIETDSTVATVGQRVETGLVDLGLKLNEHNDRLVNVEEGVKEIYHNIRDDLNGIYRNLKDMEQVVTGQKTETDRRLDSLTDMTEQVEILRDKVRSQEAVIAELEGKVAKMERDVGDTFAETGRMIRDVKDESAQRAEEIAKEMETRLMERAQEDTETKLKEATRIQDKDITVMKQRMENVFSRMRRVEEDPSVKALRAEVATIRRDLKVATWSMVGAVVLSLVCGVVTIMSLAGVA